MKCEMLIKNTNNDNDEMERYERQTIPMEQSILQLDEAAEKMQQRVDELKPFEVRIYNLCRINLLSFIQCIFVCVNDIALLRVCLKDFLEKVVDESKEFKNIDDVIKRYENLTNIRKELTQKYEKKTTELKQSTTDVFTRSKV